MSKPTPPIKDMEGNTYERAATKLSPRKVERVFEIIDNTDPNHLLVHEALGLAEPLDGERIETFNLSAEEGWVVTDSGREIDIDHPRSSEITRAVDVVSDLHDMRAIVGSRDEIIVQHLTNDA